MNQNNRTKIKGHHGMVLWFTGLSGSGKTSLALALEKDLLQKGFHTFVLDGDDVRLGLSKDLGFSDLDRSENIRRAAEVAKLMMEAGLIVITSFISPFRRDRDAARELIGKSNFREIYVNTSIEICEQRDVKGLYSMARAGKVISMTGKDSPYDPPLTPDLVIDGDSGSVTEAARKLFEQLDCNKFKY